MFKSFILLNMSECMPTSKPDYRKPGRQGLDSSFIVKEGVDSVRRTFTFLYLSLFWRLKRQSQTLIFFFLPVWDLSLYCCRTNVLIMIYSKDSTPLIWQCQNNVYTSRFIYNADLIFCCWNSFFSNNMPLSFASFSNTVLTWYFVIGTHFSVITCYCHLLCLSEQVSDNYVLSTDDEEPATPPRKKKICEKGRAGAGTYRSQYNPEWARKFDNIGKYRSQNSMKLNAEQIHVSLNNSTVNSGHRCLYFSGTMQFPLKRIKSCNPNTVSQRTKINTQCLSFKFVESGSYTDHKPSSSLFPKYVILRFFGQKLCYRTS